MEKSKNNNGLYVPKWVAGFAFSALASVFIWVGTIQANQVNMKENYERGYKQIYDKLAQVESLIIDLIREH